MLLWSEILSEISFSSSGSIRLGPALTDEAIDILMEHGLNSRSPVPFKAWKARNKESRESLESAAKKEEQETKQKLTDESPQMEPLLREAIIDGILALFPYVNILYLPMHADSTRRTIQRTALSSSSDEDLELLRGMWPACIFLPLLTGVVS
jgi:hypothetical protein